MSTLFNRMRPAQVNTQKRIWNQSSYTILLLLSMKTLPIESIQLSKMTWQALPRCAGLALYPDNAARGLILWRLSLCINPHAKRSEIRTEPVIP